MTDRARCIIYPSGKRYIQFSPNHLYISYHSRGGVEGFTYRIDEKPASQIQIPSPVEKQISAVHISGAAFSEILSANRLRVETVTLVNGIQNEDINLAGVQQKYTQMLQECR